MSPETGQAHEHIAQLVLDGQAVPTEDGLLQLGDLFRDLLHDLLGLRPVEAHGSRLLALAVRTQERRQRTRHAGESRTPCALFACLPGRNSSRILIIRAVPEDVGMALHHLGNDSRRYRVERQATRIRADLGDHQEHEEGIAELTFQPILTRVVLHCIEKLIDFLEQIGSHALEGLVFVPWTTVWTPEVSDDLDEFEKRWAILAHGWLQSGRKGL